MGSSSWEGPLPGCWEGGKDGSEPQLMLAGLRLADSPRDGHLRSMRIVGKETATKRENLTILVSCAVRESLCQSLQTPKAS